MTIVNAFTCTGAYAVLIMSGLKRVENRSCMPVPARGRCSMSVSKKFCRAEYDGIKAWLRRFNGDRVDAIIPTWEEASCWPGHIVALMDYQAIELSERPPQSPQVDDGRSRRNRWGVSHGGSWRHGWCRKCHPQGSACRASAEANEGAFQLRLDGTLTAARIAETYSISTRQAERLLTGLKKKGFLVRKGSDKGGHWEVVS